MKIMIDPIGDYWRFEKKIGQSKLWQHSRAKDEGGGKWWNKAKLQQYSWPSHNKGRGRQSLTQHNSNNIQGPRTKEEDDALGMLEVDNEPRFLKNPM